MKKIIACFIFLFTYGAYAQPAKKPAVKEKVPAKKEMDKLLEQAMNEEGMTGTEKAAMKKMMEGIMPTLVQGNAATASYPEFTSNRQLVPKKNFALINAIPKKRLVTADMESYSVNLYNKIMAKGETAEIALVKKVIAKSASANVLGSAAVLCMMQGHPQAAMALSMKAVQADPGNVNWQNNMASLLTQYGYPAQAIPVLQKLQNDFPGNSTVLNNLAMAWFNLGETDSTRAIIRMAAKSNPDNGDVQLCGGLMEELFGDPAKANEQYAEAMEQSPDPFTESMLKNNKGQNKLDNLDFEKLKSSIAIHDYFPKDWIKIPRLSDDVSGYENDLAIKNGYQQMFEGLDTTIEKLAAASELEMNSLMSSDENGHAFATAMGKEMMNGYSLMSKPAVTVINIISLQLARWAQLNSDEEITMRDLATAKRKQMTGRKPKDKCPDIDKRNNDYLSYANPRIRQFYAKRTEQFRVCLNAFCTWIWYIDGNPKNAALMQCIRWTQALKGLLQASVRAQETARPSCEDVDEDKSLFVMAPEIPNFSCPAVVSIPSGAEWQDLSQGLKNFDANSLGIKKVPGVAVPNTSIAYGASKTSIAQAGVDPSTKTSNGSVLPNHMSAAEATIYHQETMDLIDRIPTRSERQHQKNMQMISNLKPWAQVVAERALLKKMLTADCANKKKKPAKFVAGAGEFSMEYFDPRSNKKYDCKSVNNDLGEAAFKDITGIVSMKSASEDGYEWMIYTYADGHVETTPMQDGTPVKSPFSIGKGEVIYEELDTPTPKNPGNENDFVDRANGQAQQFKKDYDANGLLPTLSTGLQPVGMFAPVAGLFK